MPPYRPTWFNGRCDLLGPGGPSLGLGGAGGAVLTLAARGAGGCGLGGRAGLLQPVYGAVGLSGSASVYPSTTWTGSGGIGVGGTAGVSLSTSYHPAGGIGLAGSASEPQPYVYYHVMLGHRLSLWPVRMMAFSGHLWLGTSPENEHPVDLPEGHPVRVEWERRLAEAERDPSKATLLWAEQFSAPLTIPTQGGTLTIYPAITCKNC